MGVLIGPAVLPIAFSITWDKCSALGAVAGALVGQCAGLTAWLVTTVALYDKVRGGAGWCLGLRACPGGLLRGKSPLPERAGRVRGMQSVCSVNGMCLGRDAMVV